MTELKTLKDMQDGYLSEDGELLAKTTIKKEAIKWVKFCDEEAPEDWDSEKLREFWLQRFNISEEDLNHDKIQKGGKSQ